MKNCKTAQKKLHSIITLSVALWTCLLTFPAKTFAVQVHGPPEGLYVHIMAHIFFSAALIFLLVILHLQPLEHGKGWHYLKISLFLFLFWNIDTCVVHILSTKLPLDAFYSPSDLKNHYLAPPLTLSKWVYYVGKFDHLLCVPAMFFLTISLRTFCKDIEKKIKNSGKI